MDSIKPSKPYEPPNAIKNKSWGGKQETVPGKPLALKDKSSQALAMMPQKVNLDYYNLSPMIEKILTHGKNKIHFLKSSKIISS